MIAGLRVAPQVEAETAAVGLDARIPQRLLQLAGAALQLHQGIAAIGGDHGGEAAIVGKLKLYIDRAERGGLQLNLDLAEAELVVLEGRETVVVPIMAGSMLERIEDTREIVELRLGILQCGRNPRDTALRRRSIILGLLVLDFACVGERQKAVGETGGNK